MAIVTAELRERTNWGDLPPEGGTNRRGATMKNLIRLCLLSVFAIALGCGQEAANEVMMPMRPVTVIELTQQDYTRERTLTGVVNL